MGQDGTAKIDELSKPTWLKGIICSSERCETRCIHFSCLLLEFENSVPFQYSLKLLTPG